jgi:predicted permease
VRRLLKLAVRKAGGVEEDVDEELRFHLEMRAERLVREGFTPEEARAEAERHFGDVTRVREACVAIGRERQREQRRSRMLEAVIQDVRYGARVLKRSPAFTLVAVLTLALGIGATTALYSVVHGVLLKPLPFAEPERLVRVWQAMPADNEPRATVSPVDLEDWRARQQSFVSLGASFLADATLTGKGEPASLHAAYVDPGFFPTLGVTPAYGRLPTAEEQVPGAAAVVVSHAFWRRYLDGSPTAVGQTVTLDDEPFTVVGVMPASFTYPAEQLDVWLATARIGEDDIPRSRHNRWLAVVGRLKPGVGLEAAQRDLSGIAQSLAQEHPQENATATAATVVPLAESITGPVQGALWVLLGAVGFLLLIACANVANLLLARATLREREMAVRAALGAGPWRLAGQLLAESLLLASLGGALGVLLAVWGTDVLAGASLEQLPRLREVEVSGAVLAFAGGVTLLTGLLFGCLPALKAVAPELVPVLKGGRSVAGGGARARGVLVVAEVALAVMLAAGAGLTLRSLARLLQEDPGFRPEGAAVVSFGVPDRQTQQGADFLQRVLREVRAAPGVEAAGTAKRLPLEGSGEERRFVTVGTPVGNPAALPAAPMLHVSPGYFRAMGIPLLQGREFTDADTADTPVVLVASRAWAQRFTPGEDPVGKRLSSDGKEPGVEIVGVVGDVKQHGLTEAAPPMLYISVLQNRRSSINLVVRGNGSVLNLAAAARQAVWAVDPGIAMRRTASLASVLGEDVSQPKLLASLLGLFAGLGLLLGAVGIYGVLAYTVNQRQRELGVRLALGAKPQDVLGLVVRGGMRLAVTGVVIGVLAALLLTRLMGSVLHGVSTHDPLTFVAVSVLLLGVALLACLLPARRAMRVDPAVTLRAE